MIGSGRMPVHARRRRLGFVRTFGPDGEPGIDPAELGLFVQVAPRRPPDPCRSWFIAVRMELGFVRTIGPGNWVCLYNRPRKTGRLAELALFALLLRDAGARMPAGLAPCLALESLIINHQSQI